MEAGRMRPVLANCPTPARTPPTPTMHLVLISRVTGHLIFGRFHFSGYGVYQEL